MDFSGRLFFCAEDRDFSEMPKTREELYSVLDALELRLDTASQEISELASEAQNLSAELCSVRECLAKLKNNY